MDLGGALNAFNTRTHMDELTEDWREPLPAMPLSEPPQPRECGGDQEWPAWLCSLRHVQPTVLDSAQSLRTWRAYVLSLGTLRWVGWFRGWDRGSGTRSSRGRCFMK